MTQEITHLYVASDRLGDPDAWIVGKNNVESIQRIDFGAWFRVFFADGTDMTFNAHVVDSYQRAAPPVTTQQEEPPNE